MSVTQILLDVDGVLTNFVKAALKVHKMEDYKIKSWDFFKELEIKAEDFWNKIDNKEKFWETLPEYEWCDDLIGKIQELRIPYILSTSPSLASNSCYGKRQWMINKFGIKFNSFMIGSQKHLMANKHTVLIDDSDKNIDNFRAHGGKGIVFPQPWNSMSVISHD